MSSRTDRRVRYSQNFLHNPRLAARLVGASSLGPDDLAIEIGPGDGLLTQALVNRCRHVIAVEIDPLQVSRLCRRFGHDPNLTVFAADFLEFPLPQSRYKVFANIPFRETAAMVGKLTTGAAPPDDCYLVVQREAAERFSGEPVGTLAAVRLYPWFALSVAHRFRRSDFRPAPAVDSVLLRIAHRTEPLVPVIERSRYEDLVTAVFGAWQPSVGAALARVLPGRMGVTVSKEHGELAAVKPRDMPPEGWIALFEAILQRDDARAWAAVARVARRCARGREGVERRHRTNARP